MDRRQLDRLAERLTCVGVALATALLAWMMLGAPGSGWIAGW